MEQRNHKNQKNMKKKTKEVEDRRHSHITIVWQIVFVYKRDMT